MYLWLVKESKILPEIYKEERSQLLAYWKQDAAESFGSSLGGFWVVFFFFFFLVFKIIWIRSGIIFAIGAILVLSRYFASRQAAAAAAAKSLQSCPTLCDPIDGSPPGSPVPGILQARTLEWGAIAVSSAWSRDLHIWDALYLSFWASQVVHWFKKKKSACQYRSCKRSGVSPWVEKLLWSRKWQLTPVFWLRKIP